MVGAGAAGITLALELRDTRLRVALVESGGAEGRSEYRELAAGENDGRPYFPLASTRLRAFGGTTGHWGGMCRPLSRRVIEGRPWLDSEGWPLSWEELAAHYPRAHEICQLPADGYGVELWAGDDDPPEVRSDRLELGVFQFSPPTRFGSVYRADVEEAGNVEVYLHSTVVGASFSPGDGRVEHLRVATTAGNRFTITARRFVLACSGIQNARLLLHLLRTDGGARRIPDALGRYFMEHPYVVGGYLVAGDADLTLPFFMDHEVDGTKIRGVLMTAPDVQRRRAVGECVLSPWPSSVAPNQAESFASSGFASLRHLLEATTRGDWPRDAGRHLGSLLEDFDGAVRGVWDLLSGGEPGAVFRLWCGVEQLPSRDSRVTLAEEADRFGVPLPRLEWRLAERDFRTLRAGMEMTALEAGRLGIGRVFVPDSDDYWDTEVDGAFHHMGTTRMARRAEDGVVDPSCRVFGIENLYVSGSSVFPSAGVAQPTLTVVALAARLADHLAGAER